MRCAAARLLLMVAGCAPVAAPVPAVPAAVQSARADVERSVVERYGAAALARARSADEFIAVKHYPGLPMPDHDTDGHPIKPFYPTALWFREDGRWLAFGMDGVHPVLPRWSDRLEAVIANPALWQEPADGGLLGCTDAGGSFAWLRIKGHPAQARIGHCGGSPLTEQLVRAALMG